MVYINVPIIDKKTKIISDGSNILNIDTSAIDVEVFISGLYLTEGEDFIFSNGEITLTETPLIDENINIKYKI